MAAGRQISAQTITNLNVATKEYVTTIVSQLSIDGVIRSRLMRKSKATDGGTKIEVPLRIDTEHVESVGKYDAYYAQPKEVLDKAQYDWKFVEGVVNIAKKDIEVINSGMSKVLDLAKTRIENAYDSMSIKFSELINNPVASIGANDPDSLVKLCATENNTVGGIDASVCVGGNGTITQPYRWNPRILDYSSYSLTWTNLITPSSDYFIEKLLRKVVSQLTVGKDRPSIIICSQGIWDAYEYVLKAQKQIDGKSKETDGGFLALMFRGIPVVADNNCPGGQLAENQTDNSGIIMVLNENYLDFRHSKAYGSSKGNLGFRWVPWHEKPDQPILQTRIEWAGNITCSRRDRQGAVLGLPTDAQIYA